MTIFNQESRTKNVIRASAVGSLCNILSVIMGFVFRTVFIQMLSASYLGINGLFGNILKMMSLAELGIGTSITYRFYKPIAENDVRKVGQLMNFYKKIYQLIAVVIFGMGMMLFPFLDLLIKDANEVPADVNLRFVYILYLFQTVASYTYTYKLTILEADQKKYITAFIHELLDFGKYLVQIFVLILFRNFTLTLFFGIGFTVLGNIAASYFFTRRYEPVFQVEEQLTTNEKRRIFSDTKAIMLHRIGATVLNGTDNIVLSKFVGLAATGRYSNYALIINSLSTVLRQLMGGFNASFGNAHILLSKEDNFRVFRRLQFLDLSITGFCSVCIFFCVNDFIELWLGKAMLLTPLTVAALSLQFYFESSRLIMTPYISSIGGFVYDRYRPLIEAIINLFVSIVLAIYIGVAGIYIGTIISHLCTVFWREPLILFKYGFGMNTGEYWKQYGGFFLLTLVYAFAVTVLKFSRQPVISWPFLFAEAVFVGVLYLILIVIIYHKTEDFQFYLGVVKRALKKTKEMGD